MNFDDRVLTLFAEANPVRDDATLDELMRPSLKLIEQREASMSDTKMREIDADRSLVKQERSRGLTYGVAAAVVAVLMGTVSWLALAGSPNTALNDAAADGDPVAVIEAFLQTWSDGDVDGAIGLIGDQEWVRDNAFLKPEMEYVVALEPEGWFWSATNCTEQAPGTYSCTIALIGDPLLDVMGEAAGPAQFEIEDGKLKQVPRLLGVGAAQADQRLAQYAEIQDREGYEAACTGSDGRALEENGVVYNGACGAFLSRYLAPLAAELNAP
ncbi:MAG: hypothetical protein HKN80_10210 [Acidimicrobiia bacterium]|nr:hypothetical protein [Acidimicrobiia bacterium]